MINSMAFKQYLPQFTEYITGDRFSPEFMERRRLESAENICLCSAVF